MNNPFLVIKRPNGCVLELNSKAAEELYTKLAYTGTLSPAGQKLKDDIHTGLQALEARGEKVAAEAEIDVVENVHLVLEEGKT